MAELVIPYPDGLENAVHLSGEELSAHIRLMAALKMFELGEVSSGKAAQFAGMSRVDFLDTCGRYRVSVFNYPPVEAIKEIEKDLDTIREFLK